MKRYYLKAKYDSRASFYNKAEIEDNEKGKITLYSYGSKVCEIEGGKYRLNGSIKRALLFSSTTLRHIKEFLRQFLNLEGLTKSDLEKTL